MENLDISYLVYMERQFRRRKKGAQYGTPKVILDGWFHLLETAWAKKVAKHLAGLGGKPSRKTKMLADAVKIMAHGVER